MTKATSRDQCILKKYHYIFISDNNYSQLPLKVSLKRQDLQHAQVIFFRVF